MATTNLGKVSGTPKGEYDPIITYERLDIISHNGSSYIAKQTSTGVTPIDGEFYTLIAEKGDGGSFVKKAYKTYAAMDADKVNIPANSSVDVTNDPDESKNGAYIYDGVAFTRSQYDSKVVTDKIIADTAIAVQDAINNTAIDGGVLADTFVTATAYHADTYARTQRSIRADTVSLLDFIPTALHEGIKAYTYADNIAPYMQKAVDYCTLYNKELHCPAGGYMLDPDVNIGVQLINNWGADKNLVIRGAGLGLTVFKEADGATTRGGRYTRMLNLSYGINDGFVGDFGHIVFSDITFNKNASSNTNTTGVLYNYEQSHVITMAGGGTVTIKSVNLNNIEFIDKVGGGFNMESSPNVNVGKVACSNVISREHPKVTKDGDGTFGQRGCIEISTNCSLVELNSCDILYTQIEPVLASSETVKRHTNVNGGSIDVFEFTDLGDYSSANVSNLVCSKDFLLRGINANVSNSTLTIKNMFAGGVVNISNSTIKLLYDADTNKLTPFSHGQFSPYLDYSELHLTNVKIVIDSSDPSIRPTGFAIAGNSATKGAILKTLTNVTIDSRVDKGVNAYATGDWVISNSTLYGFNSQVDVGAYTPSVGLELGGAVELHNNKYLGTGTKIAIANHTDNYTLKISGTYPLDSFYKFIGVIPVGAQILQKPMLTSSTKPNIKSAKGQVVTNLNPESGSYEKWIKLDELSGAASWKGIGPIEGDAAARTSGTTAQRPTGVAVGFTYFDTTLGKPIYFKSTGVWVDSTGATV